MEYLARPVFGFAYDWSETPTRQATYDLRTQQIGFGAAVGEPRQQYTANSYSLSVDLVDACAINSMERFAQGVFGRLRGFWLPTPERACEITSWLDTVRFLITRQGLLETWTHDPAIHLVFVDPVDLAAPAQCVAIANVEAVDATTERVTIAGPLDPSVGWDVHRLLYVRFTEDDLRLEFYGDSAALCQLTVLELPTEYAAVELGQRPAFGYHFWRGTGGAAEHWRFTSFDQAVVIGGATYQPAPISHGDVQQSLSGDREALEIATWMFTGNPLNAWVPVAPQYDWFVEAWEVDLGSGSPSVGTLLFSGLVETVAPTGKGLRVTCSTRLDRLNRKLPRPRVQKTCNNVLYGPCCRADRAAFSFTTTITVATPNSFALHAADIGDQEDGWFMFGDAKSMDASGLPEYRAITSSTSSGPGSDEHLIEISSPFSRQPQVGDTLVVSAGCDLTKETCQAKFDNYLNFFGHPFIDQNLTLTAVQTKVASGGK